MSRTKKETATGPIRIGLSGLGRAGWGMHLSEIKDRTDRFKVVACWDPDAARMKRAQERLGCRACKSYEELVKDSEVELVDIASPSLDHVPQALKALAAGKRVFLEKPAALRYLDAQKLQAMAKKNGGKLFIRHNRRFEPAFAHIREIMEAGLLGEVYEVKLRRHSYSRRDDWQTLVACGGGQLNNWGPHLVDHALQFLDSPVESVWSDLKRVAAVGDAEDHLKILLRGKNKRLVDVEISGGAALAEPEYILFGTKGALTSDGKTLQLKYLDPAVKLAPRKASKETPPSEGAFGAPDQLVWKEEALPVSPKSKCNTDHIWDHLFAAIREGKKFPITLEEGIEVVRITELVKKNSGFKA
ncbi:MAG: Gfo/Idh/MocA family oxidoreductase [Spirochaetes bacterium]|nr:Gfo/Idh/MocA family oxidoreductase [Spirochaetota bacterium]